MDSLIQLINECLHWNVPKVRQSLIFGCMQSTRKFHMKRMQRRSYTALNLFGMTLKITHFSDKKDEGSLTRGLFKLKQSDSIQDFYRNASHSISLLTNLFHLNEGVNAVITTKKQFYPELGLKIFLSGLKEPLGPIVRAQAPKTSKEALRLS